MKTNIIKTLDKIVKTNCLANSPMDYIILEEEEIKTMLHKKK